MNTFNRIGLKTADAIGDFGRNLADVRLLPHALGEALKARKDFQTRREMTEKLREETLTYGVLGLASKVRIMFFPEEEKRVLRQEVRELGSVYKERRFA